MQDRHDRWDHDDYGDGHGTGLLWRTARNVGILLTGCLLLLGLMNWGNPQPPRTEADPAVAPSRSAAPGSIQVARATATGAEMVIPAGRNGHFMITAEVEGVEIHFLVDTGASQVILTDEDAERLGHDPEFLEFSDRFETANGTIRGAPLLLADLRIGDLQIENVRASVIRAPMSVSLLGMSFLNRLESYEVGEEGLILHW